MCSQKVKCFSEPAIKGAIEVQSKAQSKAQSEVQSEVQSKGRCPPAQSQSQQHSVPLSRSQSVSPTCSE